MLTLEQLQELWEEKFKKLGDMRAFITNENREPDEEEAKALDELVVEIEGIEARIAQEKRIAKVMGRSKASKNGAQVPDPNDQGDEDDNVATRNVSVGENRASKKKFASAGEFFQAVMRAGTPGTMIDPRLTTRAASGLQESVPSDGGFLVDAEVSNKMLDNVWTDGGILEKVNRVTLGGNKNAMTFNGLDETSRADGSRFGGIQAYWTGEADEKTGTKPKFRQVNLKLNKLTGLCYATDELLDDAMALENTITKGFTAEMRFKLTDAVHNGTGAGQPLGILNSGCLVSVSGETGQAAATLVYENINKMWSRMIASSRPNAVWVINQDVEPQLNQMSIAVGTGGVPVYLPAGGAAASPYATLFGRPVIPIEQCQTLGTVGDIMLCDYTQYYAIDKGGMKRDVSIHVRFVYDESVFRFVYRFDGQPMLGSAITPKNGTNTLSHFVALASRT